MVEVATGGNSGEQLPMVLKVPLLGNSALKVCWPQSYSLLGFGDILVPGPLVAYCHAFDLQISTPKRLYFVTTVIAYGVGLIATFLGLYIMTAAQPALLYLVPATLLPVFLIAGLRGELGRMWRGDTELENLDDTAEGKESVLQDEDSDDSKDSNSVTGVPVSRTGPMTDDAGDKNPTG